MGSIIVLLQRLIFGVLNSLRIVTVQDELFVLGKSFSYEDYHVFDASEVKIFIFDSTAFTGTNLTFNPIVFSAVAGPITIDFYTDVIESGDGAVLGASNRLEGFSIPQSVLSTNPTTSTLTTRFSGDLVASTGVGVGNTTGGGNVPGLPFTIDHTKKHAFVVTNEDGSNTKVQIKMTWFES